jgi:hypothetical protein
MDLVYEYSEDETGNEDLNFGFFMPLLNQIRISFHAFFCSKCAQEIERYEKTRTIMTEDFFPAAPNLEESIMARIALEIEEQTIVSEDTYAIPGEISMRKWVIAGIIVMLSLLTAYFALDYKNLASISGTSFLLPMGITIGIVLTSYGAFLIGSRLKELSERFGL